MTVEKHFFIENQSTWDVYYRLYLDNMEGGLADVLEVEICDGDTVLFSRQGGGSDKSEQVGAADDILKLNERRELTISFPFPEGGRKYGAEPVSILCSERRRGADQKQSEPAV